ncbi:MAG: hypothetical protein DCC65_13145 [Planctomycetota bacterium]|nr:MAG: hypothetical protein DCC65_13145 [Planctomycetota bacterium]
MFLSRNIARLLVRLGVCVFALSIFAGAECDSGVPGASSALGIGDEDSYYYGWTEYGDDGSSNSFGLSPGIDAGDALETYLSDSVIY